MLTDLAALCRAISVEFAPMLVTIRLTLSHVHYRDHRVWFCQCHLWCSYVYPKEPGVLVVEEVYTFLSDLVECEDVIVGTLDSLSNCWHTEYNMLTDLCRAFSVKFAHILVIIL